MPLTKKEWLALEKKADELRNLTLDTTFWAGSGHIGGGLSVLDILTVLYHKYMHIKVDEPKWEDRDRFILSKGHAGIAYAPVLCDLGFNDKEQLKTFNLSGSKMGMHLDSNKVVGVDASTGSLGHGMSIAVGTALAARVLGKDYITYVVLGDGECDEGSNWEAAMSASHYKLKNMISFVDRNKCMIDGRTEDVMKLEPFADKWRAFGFIVKEIDGNNIAELCDAIDFALANVNDPESDKPVMIICDTLKGCGIDFIEDNYLWHYGAFDDEKYANPRNLASGTLNLEDPAEVKARHVRFHAFTLVHLDEPMVSWGERMHFLEKLGFDVVDREATTAQKLPEAIDRWTKLVESGKMDIPVDGLVICYDDTDYAASGSVTGHHATRAGFAFKWQDEAVDTKLKYIEWSCAVSTISPVAVFEPVQIEGTTVSRASLCNISEIERLGIGKECTLSVIKANKIIPKCIAVKDAVGAPEIPSQCPVCHAPTKVHVSENSGTKTLHCTNPDCTAKNVKKFTRFVSKWGMDIDGLSIQTMLRFMNAGFIHEFADIFRLRGLMI